MPIGSVITLDSAIIAEAGNTLLKPHYNPGGHAEMEVLHRVPVAYWPQAVKMTCYSTLEPCLMCFGSLLLHGIGRVVFGGSDPLGGASHIFSHLPPYYQQHGQIPHWIGPVAPETCDPLYQRAHERFIRLPCG